MAENESPLLRGGGGMMWDSESDESRSEEVEREISDGSGPAVKTGRPRGIGKRPRIDREHRERRRVGGGARYRVKGVCTSCCERFAEEWVAVRAGRERTPASSLLCCFLVCVFAL